MAVTHWLLSTAIAKYWRLRVGLKTALRSLIPRQFTKCQLLKETCTRWMLLQGNASPYTGKVGAMYLSIIYAFISLCTYGSVDRKLGCYPHLLLNKNYERFHLKIFITSADMHCTDFDLKISHPRHCQRSTGYMSPHVAEWLTMIGEFWTLLGNPPAW